MIPYLDMCVFKQAILTKKKTKKKNGWMSINLDMNFMVWLLWLFSVFIISNWISNTKTIVRQKSFCIFPFKQIKRIKVI